MAEWAGFVFGSRARRSSYSGRWCWRGEPGTPAAGTPVSTLHLSRQGSARARKRPARVREPAIMLAAMFLGGFWLFPQRFVLVVRGVWHAASLSGERS
jgi:hypothetical protein